MKFTFSGGNDSQEGVATVLWNVISKRSLKKFKNIIDTLKLVKLHGKPVDNINREVH